MASDPLRKILGPLPEVETRHHPWDELALPEERALVTNAVDKRVQEFLTGRSCARAALRRLGVSDVPLGRADNRAPMWPEGVVGSITHTDGFFGAAVALESNLASLGIDVEVADRVDPKLDAHLFSPTEVTRFDGKVEDWRTITFSAKESIYKALNPLLHIWIDFLHAEFLVIEDGRFVARMTPTGIEPFDVTGNWHRTGGLVHTALLLERNPVK